MTNVFILLFGIVSFLVISTTPSVGYENEPLVFPDEASHDDKRLLPFIPAPDEFDFESPVVPSVTTTLENYPNPLTHPAACNRRSVAASYVCDPDGLVLRADADRLEERLDRIRMTSSHSCGKIGKQPYMMAVALIKKLPQGVDIDTFAIELLDRWGLGHSECHDGLIFMYSKEDNASVLKWKKGVEPYVNFQKYTAMHKQIEMEFRRRPVGKAVDKAVELVEYYVSGEILPPRQAPQLVVLFTIGVVIALCYLACIVTVLADRALPELEEKPNVRHEPSKPILSDWRAKETQDQKAERRKTRIEKQEKKNPEDSGKYQSETSSGWQNEQMDEKEKQFRSERRADEEV